MSWSTEKEGATLRGDCSAEVGQARALGMEKVKEESVLTFSMLETDRRSAGAACK